MVAVEVVRDWCCIRMGDTSYFMSPEERKVWALKYAGSPGGMWDEITFDQVPEQVIQEYMLWRLSK